VIPDVWSRESRSRLARAMVVPPLQIGVSGFSRYSNAVRALPPSEQRKIESIARFVVSGLAGSGRPVHRIQLHGHADTDTPRRPSFEMQMSVARAQRMQNALSSAIDRIAASLPGPTPLPVFSSRIDWRISGVGASHLAVPNPRTETDRARNRRVEILVYRLRWRETKDQAAVGFSWTEDVRW
jgi:outer membrane protein OmpA-like peptidoglycan-associated protein